MRKIDIEKKVAALEKANKTLETALCECRKVAGDVIKSGNSINPVWVIQTTTEAITKSRFFSENIA